MTTLDDYDILATLGKGAFGVVYKVRRKDAEPSSPPIALKVVDINPSQKHVVTATENEIEKLVKLASPTCNPFVICYYGSSHYDTIIPGREVTRFLIEMELIEGEEMSDYVDRLWDEKDSDTVYYYLLLIAKDILKGLRYTHNKNIIHNDIKLENIMIDKNNVPRIVDYGLACGVAGTQEWNRYESKYCKNNGGTPDYIAPEFFTLGVRLPASDLWALGIVLYIAATKDEYPFNIGEYDTIQEIFYKIRTQTPAKLNTSNSQLNDLVNGLLEKDPAKRLTGDDALYMLKTIQKKVQAPEIMSSRVRTNLGSFQDMGPAQMRRAMSSFMLL